MGKAIFFVEKGLYWFRFLLKRQRLLKLGKKLPFSNTSQPFFSSSKNNFLTESFTTTLYLLDFIGFLPTFGLFHYAKLPSYRRVRWGWLAEPSLIHHRQLSHCIENNVISSRKTTYIKGDSTVNQLLYIVQKIWKSWSIKKCTEGVFLHIN